MKTKLALLSTVLLFLALSASRGRAADPADRYPGLDLIPWPKSLTLDPGRMPLAAASRVVAADESLKPLAAILRDEILLMTGLKLDVASGRGQAGDIVLKLNPALKADEPLLTVRGADVVRTADGAHAIAIADQAVVEGFDYRAVAEGTATILQAVSGGDGRFWLPRISVKDWPHAGYCGVMLDVGRQWHPVEAIRQVAETCRLYKARYLHLHLTDDQGWTLPSAAYPQLGSRNQGAHGGIAPRVYTREELTDLAAYADARGIAIVPEIEVPGHSGAALRSLPEIFDAIDPETKQPVRLGCMNMANEEIYRALDTIIGEASAIFKSSPYFHIGSDEVQMGKVALYSGYKDFMEKHNLKSDGELANHFIARVAGIVARHGKKPIKWEGLANHASSNIVIMAWDDRSNCAAEMVARGRTTITCPWGLGVPWEQWNMYHCNASHLKRGDSVLGATVVMWEQRPDDQVRILRTRIPERQERTWGPDNPVTVEGFAARHQALDAKAGRLLRIPPRGRAEAAFSAPAGSDGCLDPVFAIDGNDRTFYRSGRAPGAGDAFTVEFKEPALIYAIEALTGGNGKGALKDGKLEVSADGKVYAAVAAFAQGSAQAMLKSNRVKAIRLTSGAAMTEPLVIREIKFQEMVEVGGAVRAPSPAYAKGNLVVLTNDTQLVMPPADCEVPVIGKGFKLSFDSGGGNPMSYAGPISGAGTVEFRMGGRDSGFRDAAFTLGGKQPNTLQGTWFANCGRVALAKDEGVDALCGTIVVGGQGDNDCLFWVRNQQVNDAAAIELLDSPKGGASLNLNGCAEAIGSLTLAAHTRVRTDGPNGSVGMLSVRSLTVQGRNLPRGVYAAADGWIEGAGLVIVGESRIVEVQGDVENPLQAIGAGNLAVLKAAAAVTLAGDCAIPFRIMDFALTLRAPGDRPLHFDGAILGGGSVTFDAAAAGGGHEPLVLGGPAPNSYKGATTLRAGVLTLGKPAGALAIPGNLNLGGSRPENRGDGVIWGADGQVAPKAVITLAGDQPAFLDLAGHKAAAGRIDLSEAARIRLGTGGQLKAHQIRIGSRRLPPGEYKSPLPWLEGQGLVTIDPRVEVKGDYPSPMSEIGAGNVAVLTGDTKFWFGTRDCDIDVETKGFALAFDSGDGNPFNYSGSISGTGDVFLRMGPSHTGYKDAPMRLIGSRPNTTTGKFHARKGRVQLERDEGVDAISGDLTVGGQGFNDCVYWKKSHQIKDSASITMIDAGNNGAAYLNLNGCQEKAAALALTPKNRVKTDGDDGKGGTLTVGTLAVGGEKRPAGVYTSATEKWIEGSGKVIVQP
jgi:hexosaminidase